MANNTETPGVVALEITPTDAEFTNTGDMRLILTGKAPSVTVTSPIVVTPLVKSLSITEQDAFRGFGLQIEGNEPLRVLSEFVQPSVASLAITERGITALQEPPETSAPDSGEVRLTGKAPALSQSPPIPSGSVALSAVAATVSVDDPTRIPPAVPSDGSVVELVGRRPTISLSSTQARIGTMVENDSATEYDGRYNICDRTGFRALPGTLVKDGYHGLVLPEYRDTRHPQEFVRSRAETHKGPKRPEPVGDELDVDEEYPDGVTIDDL